MEYIHPHMLYEWTESSNVHRFEKTTHQARRTQGFAPEYVADEISDAIVDGDHLIVIADLKSQLAIYLRLLWPALLYFQLKKMARKGQGQALQLVRRGTLAVQNSKGHI